MALINLLREFDKDNYEITLLLTKRGGEFERLIPEKIAVEYLRVDVEGFDRTLVDQKKYLQYLKNKLIRLSLRLKINNVENNMRASKTWPSILEVYDVVIAYHVYDPIIPIIATKINAKKKMMWVHSIFSFSESERKSYLKILSCFDRVVCVSDAIQKHVCEIFPSYKGEVSIIRNLLDIQKIELGASEKVIFYQRESGACILTVGRLSSEKGQQMVPETVHILLDAGYDIHWYLVGDGPLRGEIEEKCTQFAVEDRVTLLGTKMNPYPYIKECDIYVQPSFSEGYCTTTMEAKILHKPIVTTDAPGMREQFVSGENGLIVDDMTPQALADGIKTLIDHPQLREKFVKNLEKENFSNEAELQKLYDFIEN